MILGSRGAIYRSFGNFEELKDENAMEEVRNLCRRILALSFKERIK